MKICNCRVKTDKKHDVPRFNVTPAEALVLTAVHHTNVSGRVVDGIEPLPDVDRTEAEELTRLRSLYSKKKLDAIFAGAMPRLPENFDEACAIGGEITLPKTQLVGP